MGAAQIEIEKPSLEVVLKYADDQFGIICQRMTYKKADLVPYEHREEMMQRARIRIFRRYEILDPKLGWKSFVQHQIRGAILDFLRAGEGFQETKEFKDGRMNPLGSRVSTHSKDDDESIDIDRVLGVYVMLGQEFELRDRDRVNINMHLLARLSRLSMGLHVFVRKVILETDLSELAPVFGVTRERLSQVFHEFMETLKDPKSKRDPVICQIAFALGIAPMVEVPNFDNGSGHSFEPVDFYSMEPFNAGDRQNQVTADLGEMRRPVPIVDLPKLTGPISIGSACEPEDELQAAWDLR